MDKTFSINRSEPATKRKLCIIVEDGLLHIPRNSWYRETLCNKRILAIGRGLTAATCPECLRLAGNHDYSQ